VAVLVYSAVDQTKMYMVTVAEYLAIVRPTPVLTVRVAGKVRADSMQWNADTHELRFTLDDMEHTGRCPLRYSGLLPDMFAEGKTSLSRALPPTLRFSKRTRSWTSCPSKYAPEQQ
jgi:cytochrome c-type biogenesis protein CcmE